MRDYIDRIFAESSKVAKKRERIQVPDDFYNKEMDTLSRYQNGPLADIEAL